MADVVRASTDFLRLSGPAKQYYYLVVSPPISVRPNTTYEFKLDVVSVEGKAAVGVLDSKMKNWLMIPYHGRSGVHKVHTGSGNSVLLVVANAFNNDDEFVDTSVEIRAP
jgi:hypothetical protein